MGAHRQVQGCMHLHPMDLSLLKCFTTHYQGNKKRISTIFKIITVVVVKEGSTMI